MKYSFIPGRKNRRWTGGWWTHVKMVPQPRVHPFPPPFQVVP